MRVDFLRTAAVSDADLAEIERRFRAGEGTGVYNGFQWKVVETREERGEDIYVLAVEPIPHNEP